MLDPKGEVLRLSEGNRENQMIQRFHDYITTLFAEEVVKIVSKKAEYEVRKSSSPAVPERYLPIQIQLSSKVPDSSHKFTRINLLRMNSSARDER